MGDVRSLPCPSALKSGRQRMIDLALSFPTLERAEMQDPKYPGEFDPSVFARWAKKCATGSGSRNAARFVLAVWNNTGTWGLGRFDVMDAMGSWDSVHRAAFAAWARAPWWP